MESAVFFFCLSVPSRVLLLHPFYSRYQITEGEIDASIVFLSLSASLLFESLAGFSHHCLSDYQKAERDLRTNPLFVGRNYPRCCLLSSFHGGLLLSLLSLLLLSGYFCVYKSVGIRRREEMEDCKNTESIASGCVARVEVCVSQKNPSSRLSNMSE